jgi:hypothetical protein
MKALIVFDHAFICLEGFRIKVIDIETLKGFYAAEGDIGLAHLKG